MWRCRWVCWCCLCCLSRCRCKFVACSKLWVVSEVLLVEYVWTWPLLCGVMCWCLRVSVLLVGCMVLLCVVVLVVWLVHTFAWSLFAGWIHHLWCERIAALLLHVLVWYVIDWLVCCVHRLIHHRHLWVPSLVLLIVVLPWIRHG